MAITARARDRRIARGVTAGLAASLLAFSQVGIALAAQTWTVSADRLNIPHNISTTVTLTIRNTSNPDNGSSSRIGCVEVDMPGSFAVTSVQVASVSGGLDWNAAISGSSPHGVVAFGDSNGDRLRGVPQNDVLVLRVTVTAKPLLPGAYTWTAKALNDADCSGSFGQPKPLVFTVLPQLLPTPNPTPTPTPNPTPNPTPTLNPTPNPTPTSAPTPSPTRSPTPTATPAPTPTNPGATPGPTPDPTPTPTARPPGAPSPMPSPTQAPTPVTTVPPGPSPTPDPSESPAIGSTGSGGPGSSPPPDGGAGPGSPGKIETWSPSRSSDGGLSIGGFAGIDLSEFAVPGALLTGPGLLLLVLIAAQAMGALAWLPVVRKKVGAFGPGGRRRAARSA